MPAFSKWSRSNFDMVKRLHPVAREVFTEFLIRAAQAGVYGRIDVREGGTRTPDIQNEIYERGDTWVRCPRSMHCDKGGNGGFAIDFIVLQRVSVLGYEYKPWEFIWGKWYQKQYDKLRKIALELGIDNGRVLWGVDDAHFHYTGKYTTEQVAAGKIPLKPIFKKAKRDIVTARALKRLGISDIV